MSTITANYNTPVRGDYKVDNSKPLTEAEIKAKVIEVQTDNLQAIEKGLDQNSAGWGEKVKIKVPAGPYGRILYPTAKDWEDAVKNNSFTELEDAPARLASDYFSSVFTDFKNHNTNLIANKVLIEELRDALASGISFSSTGPIPASEKGDVVRAFAARYKELKTLENGMMPVPKDSVTISVPADAEGKAIKNPSLRDWIEAQKNNRWATASGKPDQLASDFYGVQATPTGFAKAEQEGTQKLDNYIRDANGEFTTGALIDIPNAGKIIAEVLAVLGPAYNTELSKAEDLRKQMDNLNKKNEAIKTFENSLEKNSAGGGEERIEVEVPTRRFVYDSEGNKVKNEDGTFKTEPVSVPPSNEDWAQAASFEKVSGRPDELAKTYFGVTYQKKDGNNKEDHYSNLTANTGKWSNERQSVSSEMSKLSGQFDFRMGNAQTNLQNANKTIASINDMMMSISRAI